MFTKVKRIKPEANSVEGILLRYDNRRKGYRIYVPGGHVIKGRSVKFKEEK